MDQEAAFAGLLNYTCTRLALNIVRRRFGRLRYWLIALITGTFKNIADEFYRRLAAPYEDRQIVGQRRCGPGTRSFCPKSTHEANSRRGQYNR